MCIRDSRTKCLGENGRHAKKSATDARVRATRSPTPGVGFEDWQIKGDLNTGGGDVCDGEVSRLDFPKEPPGPNDSEVSWPDGPTDRPGGGFRR
eukprot:297600-Alexandrium_andersonii.AAC.1